MSMIKAKQVFVSHTPRLNRNLRSKWVQQLPAEYFKFRSEYNAPRTAVNYIPRPGKYERHPETGEVRPVQNIPLPMIFPRESHKGIWGGEGVIKGFTKKKPLVQRVPKLWSPALIQTVVRSDILNKFMSVTVTHRTIDLINQHCGFDNYLLETKANDLQSMLAIRLKREILQAIQNGIPALNDEPEKQKEFVAKYAKFGDEYTPAELEWYGLTLHEAVNKLKDAQDAETKANTVPMKHIFRQNLIDDLKASGLEKVEQLERDDDGKIIERPKPKSAWMAKLNPFGKK